METCARIMLWAGSSLEARGINKDCVELAATRGKIITLLRAVLEGHRDLPTFEHLASVLDFGVLRARLVHLYKAAVRSQHGSNMIALPHLPGRSRALPPLDVTLLPTDAFDCAPLAEAFDLFLLMEQLLDLLPALADRVSADAYAEGDRMAPWFFRKNSCRVEVVRDGELQRIYFARPIVSNFLSKVTRDAFVWGVDRSSPQNKIAGLFNISSDFLDEMLHQAKISRHRWILFASQQLENLKLASFLCARSVRVRSMTWMWGCLWVGVAARSATVFVVGVTQAC